MAEKPMVTYFENCWEVPVQVLPADFDVLGHVNNVAYLRYVQEVAGAHWMHMAPESRRATCIWVVGRHEIDYKQPILPGTLVTGLTWVTPPQGMRFDRWVWLVSPDRNSIFAKAKTTWLLLHPDTGKPQRIPDDLIDTFAPWMIRQA